MTSSDTLEDPNYLPPLDGPRTFLRAPQPKDYTWLYELATSSTAAVTWRLRGLTPSIDSFVQFIWANCAVQMVIVQRSTSEPVGLLQVVEMNERHNYAYLTALIDPKFSNAAWPFEGFALFINYVFTVLNLRKIYLESPSFVAENYGSAVGRLLTLEATLHGHEIHNGQPVDLEIFSIDRGRWREVRASLGTLLAGPGDLGPAAV